MKCYVGIDLHSNNNVVVVLDEQDHVVGQTRLPNNLERVVRYLSAYKDRIVGIAVVVLPPKTEPIVSRVLG